MKLTSVVFQHFGFLPKDQHYSATRATQVKWLITLIKHQDRRIYHDYNPVTKFALKAPLPPSDSSAILASLSGKRNNLYSFVSEQADFVKCYQVPLGLPLAFSDSTRTLIRRPYPRISL